MNNLNTSRGLAIIATALYFIGGFFFPLKDPSKYTTLYMVNIVIALNFILFNYLSQKAVYNPVKLQLVKVLIIFQIVFILGSFFLMRRITL